MDFSKVKVTRGLRLLTHEDLPDEFEDWQSSLKQVYGLSQLSSDLFMNLNHTGKRCPKVTLNDVRAIFDSVNQHFSYRLCMMFSATLNWNRPSTIPKASLKPGAGLSELTADTAENLFGQIIDSLRRAPLVARSAAAAANASSTGAPESEEECLKRKLSDTNRLFTAGEPGVKSNVPSSKQTKTLAPRNDKSAACATASAATTDENGDRTSPATEGARSIDLLTASPSLLASLLAALTHDSWLWVSVSRDVRVLSGAQCRTLFMRALRLAVAQKLLTGAVVAMPTLPRAQSEGGVAKDLLDQSVRDSIFSFSEAFQDVLPQLQSVHHAHRPMLADLLPLCPLTLRFRGLEATLDNQRDRDAILSALPQLAPPAPTATLYQRAPVNKAKDLAAQPAKQTTKAKPTAPVVDAQPKPATRTRPAAEPRSSSTPTAPPSSSTATSALKRQAQRFAALATQAVRTSESIAAAAAAERAALAASSATSPPPTAPVLDARQVKPVHDSEPQPSLDGLVVTRLTRKAPPQQPRTSLSPPSKRAGGLPRLSEASTEEGSSATSRLSLESDLASPVRADVKARSQVDAPSASPPSRAVRAQRRRGVRVEDDEDDAPQLIISSDNSNTVASPTRRVAASPRESLPTEQQVSPVAAGVSPTKPSRLLSAPPVRSSPEKAPAASAVVSASTVAPASMVSDTESEGDDEEEDRQLDARLALAQAALRANAIAIEEASRAISSRVPVKETVEFSCQTDLPSALTCAAPSSQSLTLSAVLSCDGLQVSSLLRIAGVATSARRLCAIGRVERIGPDDLIEMQQARAEHLGQSVGSAQTFKASNPYLKSSATMAATVAAPGAQDTLRNLPADLLPPLPSLLASARWSAADSSSRLARATYMDAVARARTHPSRSNPSLVLRHAQAAPLARQYLQLRAQLVRMEVTLVVWLAKFLTDRQALLGFEAGAVIEGQTHFVSHDDRATLVAAVSAYRDRQRVVRARLVCLSRPLEELFATNPLLGFSMDAAADLHDRETLKQVSREMRAGALGWGHAGTVGQSTAEIFDGAAQRHLAPVVFAPTGGVIVAHTD